MTYASSLLLAALLVGCKGSEPSSAGAGDSGGTLVIATPADAGTLLPSLQAGITDRQVTDLLYDRLAEIGDDLNTVGDKGFTPQLAERWTWAPDSLSIAFSINPRARWHDGQPVRAGDVRFSVSSIKDPALGSPALPLVTNIDSVSVRDSVTAVVWFKRHTPEQFYDLVYQVAIVPEHVLSSTPAAGLKSADVARRGVGSGRFRLAKWEPSARIELVADTSNYRGRPKLDRVVFAISPDFNAAVTRFFAGDADMFENLRPEQITKMKGDTMRRIVPYPTLGYTFMTFNTIDPKSPGQPHPIFGDRNVRRALSMAVDRRAMLKNVFDTLGRASYGPFPRSISVADTTIAQLPYDPARAATLLDSAGWTRGPDGTRAKNGHRLAFGITVPNSSAARRQYAVLLQNAFKVVGAAATVEESDFPTFMSRLSGRAFDAAMANYNSDPGVSGSKQSWSTGGATKDGANFGAYSNPVVDALLDSATSSFDPSRTRAFARRAFETIVEDAPALWLFDLASFAGIDRRVRPARLRPDAYWAHLADWWIPPAQRNARDKIGLRAAQ